MMKYLRFTSIIKMRGVNPYILVTRDQAVKIKPDWKKPLPVLVQINGKPGTPWRSNMMPAGSGRFYLHGAVRGTSHARVGDEVAVRIKFDSEYKSGPQHPMQHWFSVALGKNPKAKKNWEALIPSRKKEILRYFAALKSQEAKNRNKARALDVLSGKKGRFMARSWKDGA
jgi:hypothetical protein